MEIVPLPSTFAAQVKGLDLDGEINKDDIQLLHDAVDKHKVLVIREGKPISEATHVRFGALFWPPVTFEPSDGATFILTNRNQHWGGTIRLPFHSDFGYTAGGPAPSLSLYGIEIPPGGTSTIFANLALAWQTLPQDLRTQASGLTASVVFHTDKAQFPARRYAIDPDNIRSIHPLSTIHPRTGETLLNMSDLMTERVQELSEAESLEVLDALSEHIAKPEHCYQHQWHQNDLILWDNIALMHCRDAHALDKDGPRTLRRMVLDPRQPQEFAWRKADLPEDPVRGPVGVYAAIGG